MSISIFDLFSIGIGPSSSHTVGPMQAAFQFIQQVAENGQINAIHRVQIDLYGSLALTGKGHSTDAAVLMGLAGFEPATVAPERVVNCVTTITNEKKITLNQTHTIPINLESDLQFHQKTFLPLHANGMRFTLLDQYGDALHTEEVYSIGGGFIATKAELENDDYVHASEVPYPFHSAKDLLTYCQRDQITVSELMLANELTWRSQADIKQGLDDIAQTMQNCIHAGCTSTDTHLPGRLKVRRRAPILLKKLHSEMPPQTKDHLNWLNLYALAVNEENAAGGRIVTAPTNGAAGIIPAVLKYTLDSHAHDQKTQQKITHEFLLTAGAIAILYKKGASISAAEVGCQGEIGVACSMAAGALTAVLGGSVQQVENAAEIGMEHNLGLTCDPIEGLVQVPCIERNTMGAVQAVNAANLALVDDCETIVSLDKVIATMLQTGKDMQHHYKETSLGGLAVNVPEC